MRAVRVIMLIVALLIAASHALSPLASSNWNAGSSSRDLLVVSEAGSDQALTVAQAKYEDASKALKDFTAATKLRTEKGIQDARAAEAAYSAVLQPAIQACMTGQDPTIAKAIADKQAAKALDAIQAASAALTAALTACSTVKNPTVAKALANVQAAYQANKDFGIIANVEGPQLMKALGAAKSALQAAQAAQATKQARR